MKYRINKSLYYNLTSAGLCLQFLSSTAGCSGKNENESTGDNSGNKSKSAKTDELGGPNNIHHEDKMKDNQRLKEEERKEEERRREEDRKKEEDQRREKARLKEEKKQFDQNYPLSKEGREIVEKIKISPDGRDEQIKVSGFEKDIKDKGILKIIAELDKDKINECINKQIEWSKIYKNVSAEIFAEFVNLVYSEQNFVLTFDEKTLLSTLNKELLKNILTIFNNDDFKYSNGNGDAYGKNNNFTPEVISYIAKKSKEEQKEFCKNYYDSKIFQEADFDKMTQKIDMKAIKLYEEIVEEIENDISMLKSGLEFWYLLVSNEIKLEESFFKIMLSAVDSYNSFWKRAKYFLKNDKFKSLDKKTVKLILGSSKYNSLATDDDYKNMAEYLMEVMELPKFEDIISSMGRSFQATSWKIMPYLLSKKELMKKINKLADVKKFYETLYIALDKSNNMLQVDRMKKSNFEEVAKIINDFCDANTNNFADLETDICTYVKNS